MPSVELKAVLPKRVPVANLQKAAQEMTTAISETMDDFETDFQATTRTWSNRPKFNRHGPRTSGDALIGEVGTSEQVYIYVSEGTRPHTIRPVRARVLSFQTGYRAKTSPRVIGSRSGGASGPRVIARIVRHPGTAAREFEQEIARRRKAAFLRRCELALQRAAK